MNYYNEHDSKTAAWLRELIANGLIPAGTVDERSIIDVRADELREFTQCHFFAGIGGWSYALQLAGIPATTRLWTGSCPCQPFSAAGKGLAQADERHLWPVFFDLIRQCRPEHVFGEQVASAIGHGWIDGVSADLEAEGYACGAVVLGAHSVSAPHQRQRLYWVADDRSGRREVAHLHGGGSGAPGSERASSFLGVCSTSDALAEPNNLQCPQFPDAQRQGQESRFTNGGAFWMGDAVRSGWEGPFNVSSGEQSIECEPRYKRIIGADEKTRRIPTEPTFFPLAHGVPARVVRLRGYGNAIVPQVAAEFIAAYYEAAKTLPTRADEVE